MATQTTRSLSRRAQAFSISALLSKKEHEIDSDYAKSGQNDLAPPVASTRSNTAGKATPRLHLSNGDLWRRFGGVGTEMVITKKGRRMFPALKIDVTGLEPNKKYMLVVDFPLADNRRYKYQNEAWVEAGAAFPHQVARRVFVHPDSPALGAHWMSKTASFHELKLTNNLCDEQNHVILSTLHRYQPYIHCVEVCQVYGEHVVVERTSFAFPETQFTAVTAYQNEKVTQLKIDHNPYAKGFRQNSHELKESQRTKRRRPSASQSSKRPRSETDDSVEDEDGKGQLASLSGSRSSMTESFSAVKPLEGDCGWGNGLGGESRLVGGGASKWKERGAVVSDRMWALPSLPQGMPTAHLQHATALFATTREPFFSAHSTYYPFETTVNYYRPF